MNSKKLLLAMTLMFVAAASAPLLAKDSYLPAPGEVRTYYQNGVQVGRDFGLLRLFHRQVLIPDCFVERRRGPCRNGHRLRRQAFFAARLLRHECSRAMLHPQERPSRPTMTAR